MKEKPVKKVSVKKVPVKLDHVVLLERRLKAAKKAVHELEDVVAVLKGEAAGATTSRDKFGGWR